MPLRNESRPRIEGVALEGELGRGGSAIVYRGQTSNGLPIAVKVLNKNIDLNELEACRRLAAALHTSTAERKGATVRGSAASPLQRYLKLEADYQYFEREARLHTALRGKGFVDCFDAGIDDDGRPFFILELLPAGTLRDRLEKTPNGLPLDDVFRLGSRLAEILAHAHEIGVVHRDIKPENVLFTAAGEPKISDLGLAKHYNLEVPGASRSRELSKEGNARGTFLYMAPEQATDAKTAKPQADVFSLGVVLYECVTGVLPFEGATALEIHIRAVEGRYVPPRRIRPEMPKILGEIIERCLRPGPAQRFANAGELAKALVKRSAAGSLEVAGERTAAEQGRRRIGGLPDISRIVSEPRYIPEGEPLASRNV